jgi:hypothetical protein
MLSSTPKPKEFTDNAFVLTDQCTQPLFLVNRNAGLQSATQCCNFIVIQILRQSRGTVNEGANITVQRIYFLFMMILRAKQT